jgi:VanZ family protein
VKRLFLWFIFLLGWTVLLVIPQPGSFVPEGWKYILAKTLHFSAYASLAVLSGWLQVPVRFRLLLLFFIMAHCTITEVVQTKIEGRNGSPLDVAIDNLGVLVGLLLSWKLWSKPDY